MAAALGKDGDAGWHRELFDKIRSSFVDHFVSDGDRRVEGDSQTAYVLPLSMDLLPDRAMRQRAADRLVERIKSRDWHLSTGFLGVEQLLPVLTETGHVDVAYKLITQQTYPS